MRTIMFVLAVGYLVIHEVSDYLEDYLEDAKSYDHKY